MGVAEDVQRSSSRQARRAGHRARREPAHYLDVNRRVGVFAPGLDVLGWLVLLVGHGGGTLGWAAGDVEDGGGRGGGES